MTKEQKTTQDLIDYANNHKVVELQNKGYYSKVVKSLLKHLWSLSGGFKSSRPRFYIRRKKL